ncbi:MAG: VOC family protein [bacterium]
MMKTGELVVIVDSVEEAVKFYTEKLGFDIVDLKESQSDPQLLDFCFLRKSKCSIIFRKPFVEEYAEFSFIKRCLSRCVGLNIELNGDIEKFFERCQTKNVDIVRSLGKRENADILSFTIKDPFGTKLVFSQSLKDIFIKPEFDFHGYLINKQDLEKLPETEEFLLDHMVDSVKRFGILRRFAKKYAKLKLKNLSRAKL